MEKESENTNVKKLFLLDAYALIYRSYYAFIRNPRFNSKGMNTSTIFGFTNTLEDLLQNENPSHIAVVFDPPRPTFRHEMYKEYKAQREATPEEIKKSVPYIKDLIAAYRIPVFEVQGYEADDVIGTLARKAEKNGFSTYMVTPDKDFTQLVTDKIFIYKPKKGRLGAEIWGIREVKEYFHVKHPQQIVDILALWGDSADNIPGAPGVGEKISKKLIDEFGSISNLFDNSDQLKGKIRESIENNQEQIMLSKRLATIVQDVPVEFIESEFEIKEPDKNQLNKIFNKLEFRTIGNRILSRAGGISTSAKPVQSTLFDSQSGPEKDMIPDYGTIESVPHRYYLVDNEKELIQLVSNLGKTAEFCFDTETTSLNVLDAELVGISFSYKSHEGFYVPVLADREMAEKTLQQLKTIFENDKIGKTGQNIKYDIKILKNYGIEVKGKLFDTMLAHYLIQPDLRHNLNYLAEVYLNYSPIGIEQLIGEKGKGQSNMRSVPVDKVSDYACEDADITWQLRNIFKNELKERNLESLATEIEMPLIYVLADMERSGVKLNSTVLENYADLLKDEIIGLEQEIFQMAGTAFNISSPKQLGDVLFERLKIIENAKKTKTKQYSTSEDVLNRLKNKHDIIPRVLEYRSMKKLLSTYVEVLPGLIHARTGKIHTSFNQAVAATGRLSSNNPNLQNIPIREERGREIRKAFIASDDEHILLSADYSQIELRLMAHMSEDPNMIEAFHTGEDIHTATAAKINGTALQEVTREMRSQAKTANFGIIYGISSFGLSQRLNISRNEAKNLIEGYFNTYPKVKEYMDRSIRNAGEKGYVETIMGRRRYLQDIHSRNSIVRGMAERNAINAPIQGSAADIIKLAMIRIHQKMLENKLGSEMILQVHDELVFDAHVKELERLKKLVLTEMENVMTLKVPLIADCGTGKNWVEAH